MLSADPTNEELRKAAAEHHDLEITRADSLAAGNCTEGTDDFIDRFFKGRTGVKVSELVPFIERFDGVSNVLIHKFRELEQPREYVASLLT